MWLWLVVESLVWQLREVRCQLLVCALLVRSRTDVHPAAPAEILKRYPKLTVAVIEKEAEVAPHQTGHNSGVIHAGMYYVPGSVMAKTCVRGAKLMYEYCDSKKLPHDRVGKLIVAVNEQEHKQVELLYDRGTKNGVQGLQVLNSAQVKAMEPNVAAYSALWSPNTGIVDYGVVCKSLALDVLETGRGDVKLSFEVQKFEVLPDGRVSITGTEPGQPGPKKTVTAKHVVTCAGLYSDKVAKLAGGSDHPKITAFRGTYYQMKSQFKDIVKTNVYPVPSGGGIPVGVHFTPTVNERRGHQMIIGPGACIAFSREGYKMSQITFSDLFDFVTNGGLWRFAIKNPKLSIGELYKDLNKSAFMKDAQKLVPSVTEDMVEESFTGVMAQVFEADGTAAKDYIFERNMLNGHVLNVRNAPSPACTASLAIAEQVVDIAEADFAWAKMK